MEYITYVDINGVRGDIPVNQVGNGAPTTSTVGAVGQFYMDKSTEDYTVYKCVNARNGVYTWVPFAASGGGVSGDYVPLSGHTPNQMMATDANGNFTLMNIPSGGGGSSGDYPIKYIENTDSSNRTPLRSLSSGTYMLKGYFTAYEGSTASYTFSTGMLVAVVVSSGISYVQIFYPKNNTIQYLEITDDSVTRQDAKLIDMESVANMVTQVDESSDDSHYPSAKAVYDALIGISGGSAARIGEVTLTASGWVGDTSPYAQVVNISGVTKNSQVDLTPSVQQLAIFYNKDLAFVTENENGVVTVYAIGQKPQNDYTIQVTITEVNA